MTPFVLNSSFLNRTEQVQTEHVCVRFAKRNVRFSDIYCSNCLKSELSVFGHLFILAIEHLMRVFGFLNAYCKITFLYMYFSSSCEICLTARAEPTPSRAPSCPPSRPSTPGTAKTARCQLKRTSICQTLNLNPKKNCEQTKSGANFFNQSRASKLLNQSKVRLRFKHFRLRQTKTILTGHKSC